VQVGCPLWANSGLMQCSKRLLLFDHLIGTREQRGRHGKAERFCSFEVDHQLVLVRRLDWQVSRLCASEDAINVVRRAPELVDPIGTV
jgi:hypothetical protein